MVADFARALVERQARHRSRVVHLLSGPYVTDGRHRTDIPEGSKRLLVFVALRRGRVERRYAAGTLWPFCDDARAAGNLRSALWRLRRAGIDIIVSDKSALNLDKDVTVDVHVITEWAARVIQGSPSSQDLDFIPWGSSALDLLPGWYDDWVIMEGERIRQQFINGLEALSHRLTSTGRFAEAVDVAMMAVCSEPLRESAQRALIDAHVASGNWFEGRKCYDAYSALLERELNVQPDASLAARLGGPTHPEVMPNPPSVRNPA